MMETFSPVYTVGERNAKRRPLAIPPGTEHVASHLRVNDFRHINTFLAQVNRALPPGGRLTLFFSPSDARYRCIMARFPRPWNKVFFFLDYLWARVCVKLPLFRSLYFALGRGKNRALPRAEVLGRVYRAGFVLRRRGEVRNLCRWVCEKAGEPQTQDRPSYGPLCALPRLGLGGKPIKVYKLRTMHAYAEYLQDFVYHRNGLAPGGKYQDDFRVNAVGRLLRRTFLDELPMLLNLLKGECKLVGVRPLSVAYFKLYSPRMQALRLQVKPGLIPPYYAEAVRPKTLDQVQESEQRYITRYSRDPRGTDRAYLRAALRNLLTGKVFIQ